MSVLETVAALGLSANMTALAWIMKALYSLRLEVSKHNAITETKLIEHERRITNIENK